MLSFPSVDMKIPSSQKYEGVVHIAHAGKNEYKFISA